MDLSHIHYCDIRDAVIACGWAPIHVSARHGIWRAEAGGRVGYGSGPGTALLALLVVHAAGRA